VGHPYPFKLGIIIITKLHSYFIIFINIIWLLAQYSTCNCSKVHVFRQDHLLLRCSLVHISYCSTTFHLQALWLERAEENCFSCFWQCEHWPPVCLLAFNKFSILPCFIFWLIYFYGRFKQLLQKSQGGFCHIFVLIHIANCFENLSSLQELIKTDSAQSSSNKCKTYR